VGRSVSLPSIAAQSSRATAAPSPASATMPNATLTSAALNLNDCSTRSTRIMYPIGLGLARIKTLVGIRLLAEDMAPGHHRHAGLVSSPPYGPYGAGSLCTIPAP
jgi:hypothetical protein